MTAGLPKFSYEYAVTLNETLKALGMPTAFDTEKADFSKLGGSPQGNIYIEDVLHKTFIAVDEQGTKAGAVTSVEMKLATSMPREEKEVILNRPFVYLIMENETGLPIFMGTVRDIQK